MTSGSSVYQTITSKISGVEQEHKKAAQAIRKTEAQIDTLVQEREQCFNALAEFYLPELSAKEVKQTIHELQQTVRQIYAQKMQRTRELDSLMETSEERQHQLQQALGIVDKELEEKAGVRDTLEGKVAGELEQNSAYKSLHEEAGQAQARLEQNKVRAKTFSEEAAQSLKGYETEPLFMYLAKRSFGTDSYAGSGIRKRLDNWVARWVNYKENRPKYDFLRQMPAAIEEEIARQQESLDAVVMKLQGVEQEASTRLGLAGVISEGKLLEKKRQKVMQDISYETDAFKRYAQERDSLNSIKGKYHQQALGKLREYLTGSAIDELKRRAEETPDQRDDHLVDTIKGIDAKIKELKQSAKTVQQEQADLSKKLKGLREISSHYTGRDYESSRSYFGSGFEADALLLGFLAGRFSSHQVISDIDEHQRFRPRQTYSSSSSYSSSYSSRSSSSGGGFGGGGFSSRGSFGGGGFSTGGGF